MTELCRCNNCYTILIDENPKVDATKHDLQGNEQSMAYIEVGENEYAWCCPKCETDGFLIDI